MPKRTQRQNQTRKSIKSNRKSRSKPRSKYGKSRKFRRYKIRGGCSSVSCANSGSVDHHSPQWNSTSVITGGSDMNHDLYNQYTDMTPYSMS